MRRRLALAVASLVATAPAGAQSLAALDKLIDVAQHDTDRDIRKQAMFWLGQSHEPKAIKFFQDVLRR
jgi:hypothetical protein